MRVQIQNFLRQPDLYTNFFKTFGYLIIENFIPDTELERLRQEFVQAFEKKFASPFAAIAQQKQPKLIYSYLEKHDHFLSLYESMDIDDIINRLVGPNSAYAGSDGSLFFEGSDWHRDIYLRVPSVKICCYLQPAGPDGGGDFMLFPGSHLAGDLFADALTKAMIWPDAGSGMRSGVLPYGALDTVAPRRTDNPVAHAQLTLPYQSLVLNQGDILIFDNRLAHAVSRGSDFYERKLVTMIFFANPDDMPDSLFRLPGLTREKAREEIFALKQDELDMLDDTGNVSVYAPNMYDAVKYPKLQPHLTMLKDLRRKSTTKKSDDPKEMMTNTLKMMTSSDFFDYKQNFLPENPLIIKQR